MDTELLNDVKRVESFPGLSIVTEKLLEVLKKGTPGDVMTDEQLETISGRDCRPGGDGYGNLSTAIKRAWNVAAWDRSRGSGCIKCLNDVEKYNHCRNKHNQTRRMNKKTFSKITSVNTEAFSDNDRAASESLALRLKAEVLFAENGFGQKLAARSLTTDNMISEKRLLEMFVE